MSAKQSLGKGFDALIPQDLDKSILEEDTSRVQKLLIEDIRPNPDQPRREVDKSALDELTQSVKRHGILQPIIVVHHQGPDFRYRIVAGERRWRAAKAAGLKQIPSIVRSLKELEQIELALIENIQRVDLSPLEQAISVFKLQQQFNLSLEEISKKLGKAPSTVSNLARLLQLSEAARQALEAGHISEGHARAILALKGTPGKQIQLLQSILDNDWSVRQAEQFVIATKKGASAETAKKNTTAENEMTVALSKKLGVPVKIKRTANSVQLIIAFKDDSGLQKIAEKLQKP